MKQEGNSLPSFSKKRKKKERKKRKERTSGMWRLRLARNPQEHPALKGDHETHHTQRRSQPMQL